MGALRTFFVIPPTRVYTIINANFPIPDAEFYVILQNKFLDKEVPRA